MTLRRPRARTIVFAPFVVCAALAAAACRGRGGPAGGKPAEGGAALATTRKEYVGTWSGGDTTLVIEPSGKVKYEKRGALKKTVTGTVDRFEGDDIVVDAFVDVTFAVSSPPKPAGGAWKMTVDGVELTRAAGGAAAAPAGGAAATAAGKEQVETAIRNEYAAKGVRVAAVACPGPVGPNATFTCTLTQAPSDAVPINVTTTDARADFRPEGWALIDSAKLPGAVNDLALKGRGRNVAVACARDGTYFQRVGGTFTCDVTAAGQPKARKLTVRVKDATGKVDLTLAP